MVPAPFQTIDVARALMTRYAAMLLTIDIDCRTAYCRHIQRPVGCKSVTCVSGMDLEKMARPERLVRIAPMRF